jgi:predicted esterase
LQDAPQAPAFKVNLQNSHFYYSLRCCRYIEELIDKEIAGGIPSERVVVAGFSQGGAVALMALRSEHKLAGVIGAYAYIHV